jgi:hypothetical protein
LLILAVAAALLVSFSAAPSAAVTATQNPPDGSVTIEKLKVNGTGCRPDTAAIAISPNKIFFTVTYSAYVAFAGAGQKPKEQRKACGITVRLNVPQDWTYAVSAVQYRGFARLAPNSSAVLDTRFKFQGHGHERARQHAFAGAFDDDFEINDVIDDGSRVFGPCGRDRKFDIDTELRVDPPADPNSPVNVIGMDSTDGRVHGTYRLAWKRC